MVKIFVTGFRHSGTTLLMQLLRAHPQIGWIEFEESYIEFGKSRDWVLMHASRQVSDMKKYAWGEKIPWGTRDTDVGGKRAIWMINRWLKLFKGQARVLHILRHPIDVALSGRGASNEVGENAWKFVTTTVPKVIDFMNTKPRCATILYEDLVTNPEIYLHNIFEFLGLRSDNKTIQKIINNPEKLKFRKINSDRAFSYKKRNVDVNVDFDYDKLIERVKNRL